VIARDNSAGGGERPRPLSKQEIDRRIERVLADLSAAIDAAACGEGASSGDPLRPRPLPAGALTSRMRKFVGDN
jgi:hypothetical protein